MVYVQSMAGVSPSGVWKLVDPDRLRPFSTGDDEDRLAQSKALLDCFSKAKVKATTTNLKHEFSSTPINVYAADTNLIGVEDLRWLDKEEDCTPGSRARNPFRVRERGFLSSGCGRRLLLLQLLFPPPLLGTDR